MDFSSRGEPTLELSGNFTWSTFLSFFALFFLGGLVHCCACGHSDCREISGDSSKWTTDMDASKSCKELTSCLLKLLSPKLLLWMYLCIFVYFAAPFGVRRLRGVKMHVIAEVMNKFTRSRLIRWCLRWKTVQGFGDQKTPNHLKHGQNPWKMVFDKSGEKFPPLLQNLPGKLKAGKETQVAAGNAPVYKYYQLSLVCQK